MVNVLLFGATGKLGKSVLTEVLSDNSYQVGLLIRNLSKKEFDNKHNLKLFEGDITIKSSLESAIEWADVVINCSGYVSYKKNDKEKLRLLNVEGVRNVVDTCVKYNKKLIHSSSTAVYGHTIQPDLLQEDSVYDGAYNTYYSYSKIEAEKIVLAANIRKVILRPASLISKGKSSLYLLYTIYKKGYVAGFKGGGSFAHLNDVARAYVSAVNLLMDTDNKEEMTFNLGGHNITCAEIFETFKKTIPQPTRFANTGVLRIFSIVNDLILYPVFGYSLITSEVFNMANHYNYIDSSQAVKYLNYKLTPFESSLKEIIQPC